MAYQRKQCQMTRPMKNFGVFLLGILAWAHVSSAEAGDWLNKRLPDWIKADVELRHRFEYRDNFDFNENNDDEEAFDLLRARLNLKWIPVKPLKLFAQWQDARIGNDKFANKTTFENYMDLRQLYVDYEDTVLVDAVTMNKLSLRAGRQEFSYGAQRLLGGFNWSNVAQTFDGGKLGMHFATFHTQLDILAGEKSPIKSPREADDLFDGSNKDRMWAYYATAKAFHETLIENYLIRRATYKNISFGPSGSSEIDDYTFGGRLKKAFSNGVDYELETAYQWGNFKDQDVRAMMAVGILGYTFQQAWQPRIAFEFDYGSGDSDPLDGKMTTFDNLYPTNHLFYGYMDFISLQNINDYRLQVSAKPTKKLKWQADWHFIFLDTPKDSFYSAGRTVTRTAGAGSSDVSPHVGDEIDLVTDYKLNNYISLHVGYSHFFAGKYLQETGANEDADFFYFQTTLAL